MAVLPQRETWHFLGEGGLLAPVLSVVLALGAALASDVVATLARRVVHLAVLLQRGGGGGGGDGCRGGRGRGGGRGTQRLQVVYELAIYNFAIFKPYIICQRMTRRG